MTVAQDGLTFLREEEEHAHIIYLHTQNFPSNSRTMSIPVMQPTMSASFAIMLLLSII